MFAHSAGAWTVSSTADISAWKDITEWQIISRHSLLCTWAALCRERDMPGHVVVQDSFADVVRDTWWAAHSTCQTFGWTASYCREHSELTRKLRRSRLQVRKSFSITDEIISLHQSVDVGGFEVCGIEAYSRGPRRWLPSGPSSSAHCTVTF